MHFYKCYGETWAVEKPVWPLSRAETSEPKEGFWTVHYSAPEFQSAEWIAESAGLTRDRRKVKVSTSLYEGRKVYRILRTPQRLGEILLFVDPGSRTVWYLPNGKLSENDKSSLLVGAVMGCAMSIGGNLCLHASAISLDGNGIIFIGPRTAGKSTTALYFVENCGAQLVTDDIVAVSFHGSQSYVEPGYGKIRTTIEDLKAFEIKTSPKAEPVFEGDRKIYADAMHISKPVEINMIIELQRCPTITKASLQSCSKTRSFLSCMSNIYASETRVNRELLMQEQADLKKLVQNSAFYEATLPDQLTGLDELGEAVKEALNG